MNAEAPKAPPSQSLALVNDPYRVSKVRHAMNLLVPRSVAFKDGSSRIEHAKIEVLEMKAGVRLSLDLNNDGIGVRSIDLSMTEATTLAGLLNRVRLLVKNRKDWEP